MRDNRKEGGEDVGSVVGQVVGGEFGRIAVRQKAGVDLEIGDILVLEEAAIGGDAAHNLILSVFDLQYASQIDGKTHEMISGVSLEDDAGADAGFYEPEIVNYVIASVRPLVRVERQRDGNNNNNGSSAEVRTPKAMPPFHGKLRRVSGSDLAFLRGGPDESSVVVGSIRSGSEVVENAEVAVPIKQVLAHHVLIPATTGRGKSNLVKSMLWNVLESGADVGFLVLDAHDEYHGRGNNRGLARHPDSDDKVVYYTTNTAGCRGAYTLAINIKSIEPRHFEGIVEFSDAQLGMIHARYAARKEAWIEDIMTGESQERGRGSSDGDDDNNGEDPTPPRTRQSRGNSRATIAVIQRKLRMLLGLDVVNGKLTSRYGIFDTGTKGQSTADDMVSHIESGRIVILDTSQMHSEAELVAGNIVATKLLEKYKRYKARGELARKPVASIVIEEAPRVIGEDVLASKNDSIYATIAREGRKFQVGLVAVTQLASVIPRAILANMNTKIILGNEMRQEREALIASASQDLSSDDKNIASLDRGEAIITSIFVPFAMPIKIPNFDDLASGRPAYTGTAAAAGAPAASGRGQDEGRPMRVFGQ